jgi:hypothetical protein
MLMSCKSSSSPVSGLSVKLFTISSYTIGDIPGPSEYLIRLKKTVIFAFFLFAAASYARAISYVYNTLVIQDLNCKSGISLKIIESEDGSGETRCFLPNKKLRLYPLLGQTVKMRVEYGHLVFKVKEINPSAAVGTKEQSFGDAVGNVMVSAGQAANAANGIQPPTDAEAQQSSGTVATSSSEPGYRAGVNNCVTGVSDPDNSNFYTLRNSGNERINVRFLAQTGSGGSADIDPGAKISTGDTPYLMQRHGPYEFYACQYHFVAVDTNGRWFSQRVSEYKCKTAGY